MNKRIRVGVLFGGRSAEHEVSLQSARNVVDALDRARYEPVLIAIDKQGSWHLKDKAHYLLSGDDPKSIRLSAEKDPVSLLPWDTRGELMALEVPERRPGTVDVIFPVLHGPYGEDGTVQGFLKLAGVPYVGAGVLGSAVGMDKDVMKRLLRDAGIPIGRFHALTRAQARRLPLERLLADLSLPVFVKPANLGSSVGVSKAESPAELKEAAEEAFRYDGKIVIEESIAGREIECAVLGGDPPAASIAGEVIPSHRFYSYEAKYLDENGARLVIPAPLPEETMRKVQELAVRTFQVLCCEGMGRVDFFLRGEDEILVNEINTIPGFTRISMYPKLWEASGLPYAQLIDRLIQLALDRHRDDASLRTTYEVPEDAPR